MTPTEARALATLMMAWSTGTLNAKAATALYSLADQVEEMQKWMHGQQEVVRLIDADRDKLRTQVEAMQKDVERYRHLKQQIADGFWQVAYMVITDSNGNVCPEWFGDYLDERIDRSREAT